MDIADSVRSIMRPLEHRIRSIAAACTLTGVDDSTDLQNVQITLLAGERLSNAIRNQPFGLSANPPAGAVGLAISIGGSRTHTIVFGGEDASRPKNLPTGATQLYDASGNQVLLNNDGTILIKASSKVTVQAPDTECSGNLKVDGNLTVSGTGVVAGALSSETSVADPVSTMQAMRTIYNGHVHPGVQAGSGSTSTTPETMP